MLWFYLLAPAAEQSSPFGIPADHDRGRIYKHHVETISEQNRYKLKEKLDFENETEVHLANIADSMINWETKLAPSLGLTEVDVCDIRSDHQNQAVLQRQVKSRGTMTYMAPIALTRP